MISIWLKQTKQRFEINEIYEWKIIDVFLVEWMGIWRYFLVNILTPKIELFWSFFFKNFPRKWESFKWINQEKLFIILINYAARKTPMNINEPKKVLLARPVRQSNYSYVNQDKHSFQRFSRQLVKLLN